MAIDTSHLDSDTDQIALARPALLAAVQRLNEIDAAGVGGAVLVSVKSFDAVGDGVTSDQSAVVAAVASCKATGEHLYWPAGTYLTTANVPDFHSVRHVGPGVVQRGGDTFRFVSDRTTTNKLYVSTTGADTNDGLSASEPLLTVQAALDVWEVYASSATYQFTIDLAAGTYTEGGVLDGVKSPVELRIEGKLSGGVPISIIDGASATLASGLNFNACGDVRVKNLEVSNFRLNVGSSGIVFQNGTRGVVDTCVAQNNTFGDMNCSEGGEMVLIGACTVGSGSTYGIRYYRLAGGSIGDGTNPIVADGTIEAGVLVRDGSKVVCNNNVTLNNCVYGARLIKYSYLELRDATVSNNTQDGIYADTFSTFDNASGTVTFSGNTRDKRFIYFSQDRSGIVGGTLVPNIIRGQSGLSGQSPSSGYDVVIDNNGSSGIQFLTSAAGLVNLDFNKTQRFSVDPANNRATVILQSANAYRFNTTSYIPITDNDKTLGASGFRWSVVWAGTGTISTSDAREKQQVRHLSAAERAVALRLKGLIRAFRFNDAVAEKGDGARIHFGVLAQDVKSAFEAEGLDPFAYALLCYDEWGEQPEEADDDGNIVQAYRAAGNRYGVRYEELLAFILGAL